MVLTVPEATTDPSMTAALPVVTLNTVAEAIASADAPDEEPLLNAKSRETLALALRDRRLTASQRASEPFFFRSGDTFGSGKEVWTIREAVRHMDAHPESGIYHLRNGTLSQWLSSEGAEHLARLAREVVRSHSDRRAALEEFLIGTGLVDRPRLRVRPEEIDLGYLVAGESVARRLHLGKEPGRGYLFGTVEPSVTWLSVHPRTFNGEPVDSAVTVRAQTEGLPIGRKPQDAAITVRSNAAEGPVEIPVRFRVVGVPSPLNRIVLRPAAGLAVSGALGAALGAFLGPWGAAVAGLLWAALGALRGHRQPLAWPVSYATGRWLFRILVWVVSLGLAGAAILWAVGQLRAGDATPLPPALVRTLLLIPVISAILPATLGEIRAGREMQDTSLRAVRWSFCRPFLVPIGAGAAALALAVAAPLLRPAFRRVDWAEAGAAAQTWAGERLDQLERTIDGWIDELYLRYYDG
jgi:hypothetical protein